MSGLTISDLPPELLYTILSHVLADILFDYLFVGALVPNDHHQLTPSTAAARTPNPGLDDEISSLGRVSVAWHATVQRILGALLHRPNQDDVQSPTKQQQRHRAHHLTARAHLSATLMNHPIDVSASTHSTINFTTLVHYQTILRTMQTALRDLVQHSIDTYRSEQDAMNQAHQTGVTTPTLLPVPIPQIGTTPPVPHSIHSIPPASVSVPVLASVSNPNAHAQLSFSPPVNEDHLFGALLLVAAPTLNEYTTTPLFQDALCYSQAAIFTCSSSNSFGCCPPRSNIQKTAFGGIRVQRPDVSTLVLTTTRLVTALEWVKTREVGYSRICPREVGDVADCGMREVRERIEDAIQVCRWNDLLDAVFLHGERSEEMLEALDGCFDELEANASSIQMHHLLRSNLFKTVQTIARLGPINTPAHLNTPSQLSQCSNGEVWRSRAGALAFRWMGRVVEWTGL